jgi:phosphoglycerol transferase MdoB-like AlkP superfamily enzyme
MKTCYFRYNLLMTILMCIFTIIKIHFLYASAISPSSIVPAYIRTAAFLLLFYILLNYIFFKKTFIPRLIIHELIGLVILADIMYFSYFNTLPSIAELQRVNLLFVVWGSVTALFKFRYLLFFTDIFFLAVLHSLMKNKPGVSISSRKGPIAVASLLAMLLLLDSTVFNEVNSDQSYDRFSLIRMHRGPEMPQKEEVQKAGASLIKSMEAVNQTNSAKPQYFGAAKGRNLIAIQIEALQSFVINRYYNGQELTPNLNKLIKQNSLYFDRYYQHIAIGGTSDAEFATQLSLYPSFSGSAYSIYVDRYLYGLPRILKDAGYSTMAFHGFNPEFWNRSVMYPILGFDSFLSEKQFSKDDIIGMGISDRAFFKETTEYLKKAEQPFYAFLVTLSSHHPYGVPEKYARIKLKKEHQDTLLGRYFQTINYTDAALGAFLADLKKQGLYDNSIIAVYGDHHAISISDKENYKLISDFLGHSYEVDEMVNIPLIINGSCFKGSKTISIAGGQMDFMPTLLNLMGINKSNIKFYGQDLCNAKEGFATMQHVMPKGSFIDNEKVYLAASDGIFEHGKAWDWKTRKPIDLELCRAGFDRSVREIDECKYLLAKDLLKPELPIANTPQSSKAPSPRADFKQNVKLLLNFIVK